MNYAVILAGGAGTRFWPFSRELEPKQFMDIVDNKSLLEETISRLNGLVDPVNIYIVSNRLYLYEVKKQIEGFGIPEENIILEPEGKNTAPAAGLAAQLILNKDRSAVMVILPSDHYIKKLAIFRKTIRSAMECARKGFLVTIGIKPKYPATGYGYIKAGDRVKGQRARVFKVIKFLEKPGLAQAKRYLKDRSFFWNSGIFVWRAEVFLEEIHRYMPSLFTKIKEIKSPDDIVRVWPKINSASIDYGIMVFSRKIALVPAGFYWTDLGSWDALGEILPKDKNNNVANVDMMALDSSGVSAFSRTNKFISAIGIKNLIIADTPDALLVCDRKKSQDVKRIVSLLKKKRRQEYICHLTEKRPWGRFTVLQKGEGFKIKLIEIYPKMRLSLQRHAKRAEHWIIVSGCAKVTTGRTVKLIHKNHSIYVPIGVKHRLENPTDLPLQIVEVQTGSYLEEDDIERFSDDFKR